MKNIIFIAPPAAGKGTQSTMLKESFGYNHLSTGDMLREVVSSGTDFGLQVKNIIDRGELVSDELIISLINDKLAKIDGKPFILDGFPRTLNQAKSLDNMLDKDYEVIYLDLSEKEAIDRILGRLTCSCGKSYNLNVDNLKPKVEGICDYCGGDLYQRKDDTKETIEERLVVYNNKTKPIITYYESLGILVPVNSNQEPSKVIDEIINKVN